MAEQHARNVREEAKLCDILRRDQKRATKELDGARLNLPVRPSKEAPEDMLILEDRLYGCVNETMKIMGISHGSIYKEIGAGRLPIKKAGRNMLIAVKNFHCWYEQLP